jgi:DNA-binding MarR family transcriptional regulator
MSALPVSSEIPVHSTVLIARIARAVRQRFELALTPLGLRQRHVVALSYLRGHGPTAQQMLADRLCMDASSTVCLLNELEDQDLVVRQRDRSDRRRALIELSAQGEHALREVDRVLQTVEDEILARLDPSERSALRRLLARLDLADADPDCVELGEPRHAPQRVVAERDALDFTVGDQRQ